MGWMQLIAMILQILKSLKTAATEEEFVANVATTLSPKQEVGGEFAAFGDGNFLRMIWENREEILAFALRLYDLFASKPEMLAFLVHPDTEEIDPRLDDRK